VPELINITFTQDVDRQFSYQPLDIGLIVSALFAKLQHALQPLLFPISDLHWL